jgi:hypothetical protein
VIYTPKVLPANGIEVSHNKDGFCLIFRFQTPDGLQEAVYIAISPAGAKTALEMLGKDIQVYEKEAGPITAWPLQNGNGTADKVTVNHLST